MSADLQATTSDDDGANLQVTTTSDDGAADAIDGIVTRAGRCRRRRVLVTGGCGFIGSHTCVQLAATGDWEVHALDQHSNSSPVAWQRVQTLTAAAGGAPCHLHRVDCGDEAAMERVFATAGPFDAVLHLAGHKAVAESVEQPLRYYANNVGGTLVLLRVLQRHGCGRLVFSSSATVYSAATATDGGGGAQPLTESSLAGVALTNPYARSKWQVEEVLRDLVGGTLAAGHSPWRVVVLRYFNPVGAHPSGLLGEDPTGVPNNLMPYVAQVAVGRRPQLSVLGDDYATADGTGVRDYVHVLDVADGHVAALEHLWRPPPPPTTTTSSSAATVTGPAGTLDVYNLGSGRGSSVWELVRAMEVACGHSLPCRVVARRAGDVATVLADAGRAERDWGWLARRSLATMCADVWRFQQAHPHGYETD
jgi:UDP-glucose 4-epimerase